MKIISNVFITMLGTVNIETIVSTNTLLKSVRKLFAEIKHVNLDIPEVANLENTVDSCGKSVVSIDIKY